MQPLITVLEPLEIPLVESIGMSIITIGTKEERRHVVTSDIIEGERITDLSLASKLSDLSPFLSRKVVERLKNVLEKSRAIDVDNVRQIEQPRTIATATLRSYQLEGVSV